MSFIQFCTWSSLMRFLNTLLVELFKFCVISASLVLPRLHVNLYFVARRYSLTCSYCSRVFLSNFVSNLLWYRSSLGLNVSSCMLHLFPLLLLFFRMCSRDVYLSFLRSVSLPHVALYVLSHFRLNDGILFIIYDTISRWYTHPLGVFLIHCSFA